MSIQLNHTIVAARDKKVSAHFMAEVLGLPPPKPFAHFLVLQTSNNVSLDFIDTTDEIVPQHYAFLVSEEEFDQIFARIKSLGLTYWADPARNRPNEINTHDGGRGLYFADPCNHYLEILTRPYGSGGK